MTHNRLDIKPEDVDAKGNYIGSTSLERYDGDVFIPRTIPLIIFNTGVNVNGTIYLIKPASDTFCNEDDDSDEDEYPDNKIVFTSSVTAKTIHVSCNSISTLEVNGCMTIHKYLYAGDVFVRDSIWVGRISSDESTEVLVDKLEAKLIHVHNGSLLVRDDLVTKKDVNVEKRITVWGNINVGGNLRCPMDVTCRHGITVKGDVFVEGTLSSEWGIKVGNYMKVKNISTVGKVEVGSIKNK